MVFSLPGINLGGEFYHSWARQDTRTRTLRVAGLTAAYVLLGLYYGRANTLLFTQFAEMQDPRFRMAELLKRNGTYFGRFIWAK